MRTATPIADDRRYRLTAAGERALKSERSVPPWYRAILALARAEASSREIVGGMRAHPAPEVCGWLDELETLGFVEPIAPADRLRAA